MAKAFNDLNALKKAMQNEMENAMIETEGYSYRDALNNNSDYYVGSTPEMYERTYQYKNSPRTTGVQGNGDNYNFEIYLDMGFNYETGTWSTPKIFDAIENGGGGTIGNHGQWRRTEEYIQKNINSSFGKRFDKTS